METMLSLSHKQHLKILAGKSIETGLNSGKPATATTKDLEGALGQPGASFVTLMKHKQLRGCIGSLQAHQPLAADVMSNAYSAAFRDYRFSPLTDREFPELVIKISVLSPETPIVFVSEEDLLQQIRPGIDGLVLTEGRYRGTFLPSVWEQLPEPVQFLRHLKQKAGLSAHYWSNTLEITRYTTDEF
ncbi:MAG: AmmeMemoRadiSam system protein A [SAR324 cluster bacterium]|nr:AmmeMemoRadiSam system protein A [SAR324 cluster bacterium]